MENNSRPGIDRRRLALGLAPAAIALSSWGSVRAGPLDKVTSLMPFGGYAVDGKKGRFVDQVGKRELDQSGGADITASLGSDAINRGEYVEAILDMPKTTERVQRYLAQIATSWPHKKPAVIPVRIVGTQTYGAEALPDNSIKVYLGLLAHAKSDEEVAFTLAHEYSHIVLGHLSRNSTMQKQRQLIGNLTRLYSQGVQLSEARVIKSGDNLVLQPGDRKRIESGQAQAAAASQRLRFMVDVLVEPAWSRRHEDEADALGYDLIAPRYAATTGSKAAFDFMESVRSKREPVAEALQEQLDKSLALAATESNLNAAVAGEGGSVFDILWKDFQRGLREQGRKILVALFKAKHRAPAERQKGMVEYLEKAYPGPRPMKPSMNAMISEIQGLPEFKEAVKAVSAVEASSQCRSEGDFPGAERAVAPALVTMFRNTPLVANEAGRIFAAQRKYDLSDKWFSIAHGLPHQSLQAYKDHVAMLLAARRWPRAKLVAQKGIAFVGGDRKPFLPALITIAFASRQNAEGVALLEECVKHEDPGLRQECVLSTIGPADKEKYDKLSPEMKARIDDALSKASDTGQLTTKNDALTKGLQGFLNGIGRD